jgi:hypothetical protein
MAATITKTNDFGRIPSAPSFVDTITVVPDTSYTTGGYTVGLTALLPKGVTVAHVTANAVVTSTGELAPTLRAAYNVVTDKIQLFTVGSSPAEVASASNQSANTITITVFGY